MIGPDIDHAMIRFDRTFGGPALAGYHLLVCCLEHGMHTPTPLDSAIMASMAGKRRSSTCSWPIHSQWGFLICPPLRFLAVNQAALQHYGYSQAEFLDLTIRDIRPPEDVTRLLDVLSEQASPFNETGLWKHLTRDGRVIDVEVTTHLIQFAGQRANWC